jgi:hypothetical protein
MYTQVHAPLSAKAGEGVRIIFTVTDRNGAAVALDGAEAAYRLARRAGEAALLEVTEGAGILLDGSTATVEFSTEGLPEAGGDFIGQLTLTLDGQALVAAEGVVTISPVVLP